jgi:aryl-alcohol dehydrogenase-like predicted oxidoreductase
MVTETNDAENLYGHVADVFQAEMYPVPSSDPVWVAGKTEEYIGTWLAKNKDLRSKVKIATKISGFNPNSGTVGNRTVPAGPPADGRLNAEQVGEILT